MTDPERAKNPLGVVTGDKLHVEGMPEDTPFLKDGEYDIIVEEPVQGEGAFTKKRIRFVRATDTSATD